MATAAKKHKKQKKDKKTRPIVTAGMVSKHELYQASVQNVEAEIDFVDQTFRELRGRDAVRLREDFCGTGNTSCEWVRRRASNEAWGLDIDAPTLAWGQKHMVGGLEPEDRGRVHLLERNVLEPGDAVGMDAILAMNFSYWLFMTRAELLAYFRSVRESLADGGIFFQDFYGGSETMEEREDARECELPNGAKFTYIWDQCRYRPVTGEVECRIHFKFKDGSRMRDAFVYHWRLWSLVEIQELLAEAGFSRTTVYWEGDELDGDGEPTGEGNGVFTPEAHGQADPAFICYIVSEK
jgi:cyclopropane fatty-acyl-phospholipid synthase-like methyltransferase